MTRRRMGQYVRGLTRASVVQAGTRLQAIQLLRRVQSAHPDLTAVQSMIDRQTRSYLSGRIYALWRAQALDELRTAAHAAVGYVLLQQHAVQYAEQSALPDLLSDANQLLYAASLRTHAQQVFADDTASEQAVLDAGRIWTESAEIIGDVDKGVPAGRRRLTGLGSVKDALDAIQVALDGGRLQRARRLIAAIAAVDPAHPDIRRWSQALDSALKNRDRARAEYVAACEARLDRDWPRAVQRLKAAIQARPCKFYEAQLQDAEAMIAWQEAVQSGQARAEVQALVSQGNWTEAMAVLDRIGRVRSDDDPDLGRWRAFVQVGLDQDRRRRQSPAPPPDTDAAHVQPEAADG